MKHCLALLMSALICAPANADTPMTAAEFEAYVTGHTIYFGEEGNPYGAENYLQDRKVQWSFLDGQCKEGFWYNDADLICFVYEDLPDPQCWSFYKTDGGIRALFQNDANNTTLYEVNRNAKPLVCLGPEVGV